MLVAAGSGTQAATILRQLIDLNLVTLADAVERGLSVLETSISHRSFIVWVGGVPRFFVKQADLERSLGRDLRTEATIYRLTRSAPGLRAIAPRCRHISEHDDLIVLDAVPASSFDPTALALGSLHAGAGDVQTQAVLRRYGAALARVHENPPRHLGRPPWLLVALEQSAGGYPWLPAPCRDLLLRVAESPTFRAGFAVARSSWRATSLIHGDLRWANLLTTTGQPEPRIWLVDWELACRGDPAWDIGCVLADTVTSTEWIRPDAGTSPPAPDAFLAFLRGYQDAAQPTRAAWLELLSRSVRLAGVRLLQTLIEYGHIAESELRVAEPVLLPSAARLVRGEPLLLASLADATHAPTWS